MSELKINSYRDLQVWQDTMALAEICYRLTRRFPKDELFGFSSQIRRAAASLPANIAEGCGRETTGNFIQSLRVAQGSLKELETHLLLAERVGVIARPEIIEPLDQFEKFGKMLRSLIRSLERRQENE